MRRRVLVPALAGAALLLPLVATSPAPAQEKPAVAKQRPVTVGYYYRVRWGFQDEFERLFSRTITPS